MTIERLLELRPEPVRTPYGTGKTRRLLQVSYPDPKGGQRRQLNISYVDDAFVRALDALVRRHPGSSRSGMVRSATMRLTRLLKLRMHADLKSQLVEIAVTYGLDMSKAARWAVHTYDIEEEVAAPE